MRKHEKPTDGKQLEAKEGEKAHVKTIDNKLAGRDTYKAVASENANLLGFSTKDDDDFHGGGRRERRGTGGRGRDDRGRGDRGRGGHRGGRKGKPVFD